MEYVFTTKDYGQGEGFTILPAARQAKVEEQTGESAAGNTPRRGGVSPRMPEPCEPDGDDSISIRSYDDPEHKRPYTAYEILTKFYHEDMGLVLGNYLKLETEKVHSAGIMREAQKVRLLSYHYRCTRSRLLQNPKDTVVDFIIRGNLEGEVRQKNSTNCIRGFADFRVRYIFDIRPCHQLVIGPLINPYQGDDAYLQQYPIATNDYLLPILYASDYELVAHEMIRYYFPETAGELEEGKEESDSAVAAKTRPITAEALADRMGLEIQNVHFADLSIMGQLYYNFAKVQLLDDAGREYTAEIKPGTILLSLDNCRDEAIRNSTIAHECSHMFLDRWFFLLQMMAGNTAASFTNRRKERSHYAKKTPVEWMELQCEKLPAYLLLEKDTTKSYVEELLKEHKGVLTPSDMRGVISAVSRQFHVSFSMAKYRLEELGYHEAGGISCYVDHTMIPDHGCSGRWPEGTTYTISAEDALDLQTRDFRFASLIRNGSYRYVEGHFCRNSREFLEYNRYGSIRLTDYARSNMDKCCLAFSRLGRQRNAQFTEGYASRNKTEQVNNKYRSSYELVAEPGTEQYVQENRIFADDVALWGDFQYDMDWDYGNALMDIMQKKGITQEALAMELNIDRKMLYNCLHAKYPSMPHLVAICVALKLPYYISATIINHAGLTFARNDEDSLYQMFLLRAEQLSVERCNDILRQRHFAPLIGRKAS